MTENKKKIAHWHIAIFANIIILVLLIWYPSFWLINSGENILAVKFWLNFISTQKKSLLLIIGYPIALFELSKGVYVLFDKPFLSIFGEKSIFLYSLSGNQQIKWSEVSSLEVKQLENLPGRKSKSYKIFEVTISKIYNDKEIKFTIETFSDTKIDSILNLKNSSSVYSPGLL
jgi:hypothetical protein